MPEQRVPIVVFGALAANLVIAVAKFVAAAISGSSAMFAEGVHSVVDTGNEVLLLVGLSRAKQRADADHPFGYGKELYFWSLLVAMLLFGIGGGMSVYEGARAFLHPAPHRGSVVWNYVVLAVAFAADGTSWWIAARALRRAEPETGLWRALRVSKDPTEFIVLAEDSAAIVGLGVAFLGVLLGQLLDSYIPDAIASIVVGVVLCATAVVLVIETKALLIGESADPELVRWIEQKARSEAWVCATKAPRTMHFGPRQVLVTLDVEVAAELSAQQLGESVDALESTIRAQRPEVRRVYVAPHAHLP
jgi:cation diffusion facilitator family transporter